MAKTPFAYGTTVASTFLNTIFKDATATGSRHDGSDADGHLPKINLAADAGAVKQEVTGVLPLANIHGAGSASVVVPVTGTLAARVSATHVATEVNGTAVWAKVGGIITLALPRLVDLSDGDVDLVISFPDGLPTYLRPNLAGHTHVAVPISIQDNGFQKIGVVQIRGADSWVVLCVDDAGSLTEHGWYGQATAKYKGVEATVISYVALYPTEFPA
jgi:hypothetical protein